MTIELTKRELRLLQRALMDAMAYERDFIDCHMNERTNKPKQGSVNTVKKSKAYIKTCEDMRVKMQTATAQSVNDA